MHLEAEDTVAAIANDKMTELRELAIASITHTATALSDHIKQDQNDDDDDDEYGDDDFEEVLEDSVHVSGAVEIDNVENSDDDDDEYQDESFTAESLNVEHLSALLATQDAAILDRVKEELKSSLTTKGSSE